MEKLISEYEVFKNLIELPFIESIYLYGSRARGDNQSRSDIDLLLVCPTATEDDWQKVQFILAEENVDTLLKIDFTRYEDLVDDYFKTYIEKDKKLIFNRNSR